MDTTKYGHYIVKGPITKSMFRQVKAPQFLVSGEKDCNNSDFSLGWSFITEPFLMVDDSHTHDFDQIVCFLGGDPSDITGFDAEVELFLGEEKHIIDSTSFVYIPEGLEHCPLNVKTVNKPFMFIDIVLSPRHDVRPKPEQ